jgi:ABC transporter transmembrane region
MICSSMSSSSSKRALLLRGRSLLLCPYGRRRQTFSQISFDSQIGSLSSFPWNVNCRQRPKHHPFYHQCPLIELDNTFPTVHKRWKSTSSSTTSTATKDIQESTDNNSKDPSSITDANASQTTQSSDYHSALRISKTLARHVWPSDDSEQSKKRKERVLFSMALMLSGKAVTIQVPYIFKSLVDSLPIAIENASTGMAPLDLYTATSSAGIPMLALLMGYGMSRAASSGFNEWRNAVFAHVAQDAIRNVGRNVFQHVHSLDMQFHLNKNTGKVSRILDRGNRSISFVLNAMVFNIFPTTVEVALVTSLVYYQFGTMHAGVVLSTIAAYTAYTVGITQWRTKFRRDMNRLENQASSRVVDSLVNYETVQYFNNLPHEV